MSDKGDGDANTQNANEIIKGASHQPQSQSLEQGLPLRQDIHAQGSAEETAEESASLSHILLVGEGVHHPLHSEVATVEGKFFDV